MSNITHANSLTVIANIGLFGINKQADIALVDLM